MPDEQPAVMLRLPVGHGGQGGSSGRGDVRLIVDAAGDRQEDARLWPAHRGLAPSS